LTPADPRLLAGPGENDLAWAMSHLALVAGRHDVAAEDVLGELAQITAAMLAAHTAVALPGAPDPSVSHPLPSAWGGRNRAAVQVLADAAASYTALIRQRDQARAAEQDWRHRATHDALTGLPNRQLLLDLLDYELRAAVRDGTATAVLFIDIDRFKGINDSFGHSVGDQLLVEVTRRLSDSLRANDTLARLAGDEFVAVCAGLSGPVEQVRRRLLALGRRIGLQLGRRPHLVSDQRPVSVSIGAVTTTHWRDPEDLIRAADDAMYEAKHSGGRQLVINGTDMASR
jgi:diguanylate cyclase (GGDEF)-like protein